MFEGAELTAQSLEGLLGLFGPVLGHLPLFAAFAKRSEESARLLGEFFGVAQLGLELVDFGADFSTGGLIKALSLGGWRGCYPECAGQERGYKCRGRK